MIQKVIFIYCDPNFCNRHKIIRKTVVIWNVKNNVHIYVINYVNKNTK